MAVASREEAAVADGEVAAPPPHEVKQLIPGLPDEVAEYCLLRLPFPDQSKARSVSSSWKRAISSPSFQLAKKTMSLSLPYLFVFAFHRSTFRLEWQAFDPRSRSWFALPPMPLGAAACAPLCPPAFTCVAIPHRGELFVLGGMRSDTQTPLQISISYRASTNSWSVSAPMPTPRSFFVAGSVGGKIVAAGGFAGGENAVCTVESYDPTADHWAPAAKMRWGVSRYDAAVVGEKLYVTEGWTWPFSFSPRGGVYSPETDSWEEMPAGMRDGWTGVSVVVSGRLFLVSEYGDGRVKIYDEGKDCWEKVGGGGIPCELQKPYAIAGVDGRIYVVACGLNMGIGTVIRRKCGGDGSWCVEWELVKGRQEFIDLAACSSEVLYA